ncbi:uncharacterized protein BDZ99DRAFT_467192 [Mytilinidion resinicola]|uniref:F-box domain-containing protein n=1 Tax=Mytilinidion resinicola TaxID=574789 RepID=A0A6A6Y813_9PEZI|nr:uncharacterized protein BDZ99DRAFT_467192 [Mytilinidion resinicola]KAF2804981.1 hypothetical protein BDZ99DRAFT_467192 [Mytilinidion resinicola]
MVCPLIGLADELQLTIVEAIQAPDGGREDLVNLSNTCSTYHSLLAPIIFDRVTLLNDAKSATSAIALASSPYGQYVKELRFEGSLDRDDYNQAINVDTDGISLRKLREMMQVARQSVFPRSVYRVMSNLEHWFPKLDTLTIRIEEESAWHTPFPRMSLISFLHHPDPYRATLRRRKVEHWKMLLAQTYEALCENENHNIRTLQLFDLVSKSPPTFSEAKFHRFLEKLETFRISLVPASAEIRGSGLSANFTRNLSGFFLDHLPSVQHFKLEASEYSAWSDEDPPSDWTRDAALPLTVTQMSKIKSINLAHVLVCKEMIAFFVSHQSTLEQITLNCCYARHGNAADGQWRDTWGNMFEALTVSGATFLRKVNIEPIHCSDCMDTTESHQKGDELPYPRAFAYGLMNNTYGYLASLLVARENDQVWYSALEELIRGNRARDKR